MGIAADEKDDNDRERISLYGQSGGGAPQAKTATVDAMQYSKMKHDVYVEDPTHPDGKRPVSTMRSKQGRLKPHSLRDTTEMGGLRQSSQRRSPDMSLIPDPNAVEASSNPDEQLNGPKKVVLDEVLTKELPTIA